MRVKNVLLADFSAGLPDPDPDEVGDVLCVAADVESGLNKHARRVPKVARGRAGDVRVTVSVDDYALSAGVGYYSTLRSRPLGEDVASWRERAAAAPRELVVDVSADEEWLLDGSLATEGSFGRERAEVEFKDAVSAIAWVRERCRHRPSPRVTPAVVAVWEARRVSVRDPDGGHGRVEITLLEAVRTYGGVYRGRVSPELLRIRHDLSEFDAEVVVEAVRRMLPRSRP